MPGKALSPGVAFAWIGEGWGLFRASALMWVVLTLLLLIVAIAFTFIPFLGSLAWQVLTPVIAGGLVLGCRALENGEELELEHLVAGFKRNFPGLAIVGAIYVVGGIVVLLVFGMFVGLSLLPALLAGDTENALGAIAAMGGGLLIGTLVVTILSLLLGAAVWLAPALVVLHGVNPVDAMKASFFGAFRNFIAVVIYAIVMFLLAILAAIPFGLGMLVWVPLLVTSSYRAYRQIFT
ncbi:hypothetical protein BWI17_07625 [Betaproteobacteria bacterium GR16-43]|nr:hypothetical protein BWI17_07625 [Betaproteobacteria bacterium GR16-43]